MSQFGRWVKAEDRGRRGDLSKRRPAWDCLERRSLMAASGSDYVLTGYKWDNPAHITYSIAPDGVFWDHGTNQLNSVFSTRFGNGNWQRQLALALATWESVANINITPVGDSAFDLGAFGKPQGDPRFGDIRVGGYDFHDSTTLAQTYYPPPQGTTHAGDLEVNTGINFAMPGQDGYDVYSVLLHETGHALGLDHAATTDSVMYAYYQGVRSGLGAGDIAGIRAIYGARVPDRYQAQGTGTQWSNAIDVTGSLNAGRVATVAGVSLPSVGATEYFTVVAPSIAGQSLSITAAAGNVSMLSPKVSLYDASGTLIDTESNPSGWGTNVTVAAGTVVPGQRYYVTVTGATGDVFAVGGYQLQVAFTGGASPGGNPAPGGGPGTSPPPAHQSNPPPVPRVLPDPFEFNNIAAFATNLGQVNRAPVLRTGLTINSPADVDYFVFRNARPGIYQIAAQGTVIRVLDASGRVLAMGVGQVAIRVFRARTPLYIQISGPPGSVVPRYAVAVLAQAAQPVTLHPGAGRAIHRQTSHWPLRPRNRVH